MSTVGRKRGRGLQPPKGYAKRLSPYGDKGRCGDEVDERVEPPASLERKVAALADAIRAAKYVVAHTGAGISTAAHIPDFRGKDGIWTRQKLGHPLPKHEKFWANAVPTLGHMALVGLMRAGLLSFIVSQNVDGLHLRSGVPRDRLSELHGNMLRERCETCGTELLRTADVGGIGMQPTGRSCPRPRCGSRLMDVLLDWEDDLPEPDFGRALAEAAKCRDPWTKDGKAGGLALCLGTSMQMSPARDLPCEAGRFVVVNLQETIKDDEAWLVLRARIDDAMHLLCRRLAVPIPAYERAETFYLHHHASARHVAANGGGGGDDDSECAFHATYRFAVGESTRLQDAASGYLAAVTLALPGGEEVRLAHQPFTHSGKAVVRWPRAACPHCTPASAAAGAAAAADAREGSSDGGPQTQGVALELGVTVEFEPTPAIRAGGTVLPSATPAPWRGRYAMPLHRPKGSGERAVTVVLARVDYGAIYTPSSEEEEEAGPDGRGEVKDEIR